MQSWDEILDAIKLTFVGRSDTARAALEACWARTGPDDAGHRCVIAHYLADQQETLDDEIDWDEKALAAFEGVGDAELSVIGVASTAGFEPSLRLNLGDGYLRAGRLPEARAQVDRARAFAHHLAPEGYGAMVRSGIDRLEERIAAAGE